MVQEGESAETVPLGVETEVRVGEPEGEALTHSESESTSSTQDDLSATKNAILNVAITQTVAASQKPSDEEDGKRLTKDELLERLRLTSTDLVDELHSLALRQNSAEDAREGRLDGKAQGLLATAGLSLTVAFTFGSIILSHPEYSGVLGRAVWVLYALALMLGLGACAYALCALFVSDGYGAINDHDVFNEVVLEQAEAFAADEAKKSVIDRDSKVAQRFYRRFITVQHWLIYRRHFNLHDKKASRLKVGQWLFGAFLFVLFLIGLDIAISAGSSSATSAADAKCLPTVASPQTGAGSPTLALPQTSAGASVPSPSTPPKKP